MENIKFKERKAFNFYRSYYETSLLLDGKDKAEFLECIINYQFTGILIEPKRKNSLLAFRGQIHSINKQIIGFDKGKDTYPNGYPTEGKDKGKGKGSHKEVQEEEQVQDEVEEKEEKEGKELFLLEKETKEENLPKENQTEIFPQCESVETGEEERKKVAPKKERFKPPTVQEVQDYCNERQNGIQAYTFVNFYQSKGWKVGNQPMKDWKAAVRTWEQKNKQNGITNTTNAGFSNNATVSNGKVSGRSIVADRISQHLARNSESGNHTIDIEANIVR